MSLSPEPAVLPETIARLLRRNATRQALVPHTDDSEVTLNVNLAAPPRGGRLLFRGLRNSAGEGRVGAVVTPVPGSAVPGPTTTTPPKHPPIRTPPRRPPKLPPKRHRAPLNRPRPTRNPNLRRKRSMRRLKR